MRRKVQVWSNWETLMVRMKRKTISIISIIIRVIKVTQIPRVITIKGIMPQFSRHGSRTIRQMGRLWSWLAWGHKVGQWLPSKTISMLANSRNRSSRKVTSSSLPLHRRLQPVTRLSCKQHPGLHLKCSTIRTQWVCLQDMTSNNYSLLLILVTHTNLRNLTRSHRKAPHNHSLSSSHQTQSILK